MSIFHGGNGKMDDKKYKAQLITGPVGILGGDFMIGSTEIWKYDTATNEYVFYQNMPTVPNTSGNYYTVAIHDDIILGIWLETGGSERYFADIITMDGGGVWGLLTRVQTHYKATLLREFDAMPNENNIAAGDGVFIVSHQFSIAEGLTGEGSVIGENQEVTGGVGAMVFSGGTWSWVDIFENQIWQKFATPYVGQYISYDNITKKFIVLGKRENSIWGYSNGVFTFENDITLSDGLQLAPQPPTIYPYSFRQCSLHNNYLAIYNYLDNNMNFYLKTGATSFTFLKSSTGQAGFMQDHSTGLQLRFNTANNEYMLLEDITLGGNLTTKYKIYGDFGGLGDGRGYVLSAVGDINNNPRVVGYAKEIWREWGDQHSQLFVIYEIDENVA